MIESVDFPIVGSYNNQRIHEIDAERSVNCFEYVDVLGKKPRSLINTSGLINTNGVFIGATGGYRAQFVFENAEYDVIGNGVYRIDSGGTIAFLGNINTLVGYVGITANMFQVIIVDGLNGWIWDTNANTFTQITDPSFPIAPIDVTYLDGYFIVPNGNTNNFQLSLFNQGLVWGPASFTFTASNITSLLSFASTASFQTGVPLTFTTTGSLPAPLNNTTTYFAINVSPTTIRVATTYDNAIAGIFIPLTTNGTGTNTISSTGELQLGQITSDTGTIVASRVLHRRLFLFSQFFTEVWENAGIGTNLPFRRNNSLLMQIGTAAIGSIAIGSDKMFFLAQDRDGLAPVMQVDGTQSMPVSNRALDSQLARYAFLGQISDCRSFVIKENGLFFYRMNFTLANHTFVYNATLSNPAVEEERRWHEEEVLTFDRHLAQTHAYFNGVNYVGNYKAPIRYIVDARTYTNDGQNIRRMRIWRPQVTPGYQRRRVDRFQVDFLQGNVALAGATEISIDLLTEAGTPLLTESGENILLEQSSIFNNPMKAFVFLSISKDGGQTYGYTVKAPMGNVGQRHARTVWRKLGVTPRGQAFVGKIEFFENAPFICLGASWVNAILPQ